MSELTEALGRWDSDPYGTDLQPIVDAARKYAALTSPETIEKAARAIWERSNDGNWYAVKQARTGSWLKAMHDAEAVLLAVSEDTE